MTRRSATRAAPPLDELTVLRLERDALKRELAEAKSWHATLRGERDNVRETVRDLEKALLDRYELGRGNGWWAAFRHVVARLRFEATRPQNAEAMRLLNDLAAAFEGERPLHGKPDVQPGGDHPPQTDEAPMERRPR